LQLPPEEVGFLIVKSIAGESQVHPTHFASTTGAAAAYQMPGKSTAIAEALSEAWAWLEREGLVVRVVNDNNGWMKLSKRGRQLADQPDVRDYRQAHLLPKASLHPALLAAGVDTLFILAKFDTAVFEAFKTLEIRVREAADASADDIGVDLMRKAFNHKDGKLRLGSKVNAEREALSHLMAGAIGLYKNPQSHRDVGIDDAAEAAEIVLFASHLLRTIDRIVTRDEEWRLTGE
jgi:uncharacterized protein (TIGR02391 family)